MNAVSYIILELSSVLIHASTTEMHVWSCDCYRQCGDILLPASCTHRLSGGPSVYFGGSSSLARVEDWQPCCCCVRLSDRLVAHSPCLRVSWLFMCASRKIYRCVECRRADIKVRSKVTLTRSKRIHLTHYLHDSIEAAAVVDFCNSATWRSGKGDMFFFLLFSFSRVSWYWNLKNHDVTGIPQSSSLFIRYLSRIDSSDFRIEIPPSCWHSKSGW